MTYQELRTALRKFRIQGHVVPALNSKKEVLEAAYNAIMATKIATEELAEKLQKELRNQNQKASYNEILDTIIATEELAEKLSLLI